MSLLMDALKKADETNDLPTLPNTFDINKDEEQLSVDIINDNTPITSPPTSNESLASDEEEQSEKISSTWDNELLQQFQQDKKSEALPSDEIAPLNDNINIDSDKPAVLGDSENELKNEEPKTIQTSVETPKQMVAEPGFELKFKSEVTKPKAESKVDEKKVDEKKANERKEFVKTMAKQAHYPKEAQRILAAGAPPTSSRRTFLLSGVLIILIIVK